MRGNLESALEVKAVKLAWEQFGVLGSKLSILGDTGYPDRIFWLSGGRPWLVEFKRPGESPRKKQVYIHAQLRRLGYDVEVHDDLDRFVQALAAALGSRGLYEKSGEVSP